MMMPQQPPPVKPEQLLFNMKIVTIAMLFSVMMFGYILFMTVHPIYDVHQFADLLKQMPNGVIFFMGVMLLLIRVPIANSILAGTLKKNDGTNFMVALQGYFISHILRIAMAEAAAMLGFVITMQTKEVSFYAILGAAALVAIVLEIPTQERVRERIKAIRPDFQFQ